MREKKYRIEKDSLGERRVPEDKYYGVQTLRAIENFKISGVSMRKRPKLIKALAAIKHAAAKANYKLGLLDREKTRAIVAASEEVFAGQFDKQFPVDMIQGGAGTSANMNANEVICNRALEILGHEKGEYKYLHPNNHVNLSQSTNDVYPTAAKVALVWSSTGFIESVEKLRDAFHAKSEEFKGVIKIGRTQLQDAVPMTLGQEFHAFASAINEDLDRIKEIFNLCYVTNMGATAIGTGINTLPGYSELVCKYLAEITQLPLVIAPDLVEATSDTGVFVSFSSILKRMAIKLTKVCNDLRLLSSGPQAGLHDINLPAVQPGSSIMPAKVNPVIPEVVNQVCFQVMGCDLVVTMAASGAQMQLNAFEPVMVYNLMEAMTLMRRACKVLREKCVDGIEANVEYCREHVLSSAGLLTAFAPYIGYEAAAKIAKQVQKNPDKSVYELVKEADLLSDEDIDNILSPEIMTTPHVRLDIVSATKAKKEKN